VGCSQTQGETGRGLYKTMAMQCTFFKCLASSGAADIGASPPSQHGKHTSHGRASNRNVQSRPHFSRALLSIHTPSANRRIPRHYHEPKSCGLPMPNRSSTVLPLLLSSAPESSQDCLLDLWSLSTDGGLLFVLLLESQLDRFPLPYRSEGNSSQAPQRRHKQRRSTQVEKRCLGQGSGW
jgi:hypothetical protein